MLGKALRDGRDAVKAELAANAAALAARRAIAARAQPSGAGGGGA
ncbi:MAG: hypothetical protein U1E57_01980 [Paenacidovorax caeni]